MFIYVYVQELFHINDESNGELKKTFLKKVSDRFRQYKTHLIDRFIKKTKVPKGEEHSKLQPWEVYPGRFNEEEWKEFEERVTTSEEFLVNGLKLQFLCYQLISSSFKYSISY